MRITGAPDRLQDLTKSRTFDSSKCQPHVQKSPRRSPGRSFACQARLSKNDGASDQNRQAENALLQACQGQQHGKSSSKRRVSTIGSSLLASALTCTGGGNGGGAIFDNFGRGGGGGDGGPDSNSLFELAAGSDQEDYEEEEEVEESEEEDDDTSEGTSSSSDDEDEVSARDKEELGADEFKVDEVRIEGLPEPGEGVPTEDELLASCATQPGFVCNKEDINTDKGMFSYSGVYQEVDARVTTKNGKTSVIFKLVGAEGPPPKNLDISAHKATSDLVFPASEIAKARRLLLTDGENFGAKKMYQLKSTIEDWYRKQGYSYCYVTTVEGIDTGHLKVKVLEGRVGAFRISPVDAEGKPTEQPGHVPQHVILREIPFQRGDIYHQDMPQKCLRDVFGLGLFETMSVGCQQSHKDESKFDIDLQVKERPAQTGDLDMEWSLAPSASGKLGLASIVPGGSLVWENSNLGGKWRSLAVSATTSNFLDPEDLGFQLTYRHPDFRGIKDAKRTELNANFFNTRNLSAVFTGRGRDEHGPIMVDRTGVKVTLQEKYSRNSTGIYGLVAEQVANLDENMGLISKAAKTLPTGTQDLGGPPTSLSPSGKDRLLFFLANFSRDTTHFVNGTQLGDRQTFQMEQSLGVGDTRPVFNRQRVQLTHFQPLGKLETGSKQIPASVVVHAGVGACIGDQPPYELFTLGGPLQVRGYNVGEIAASRAYAEGAVEVRVPVKGRRLYAFAEGASDLNSSRNVVGNPTAYFNKVGSAVSLGGGIKLGAARFEAATEGLSRPSVFNVRFGERF